MVWDVIDRIKQYPSDLDAINRGRKLRYADEYAGKWARPDLPEHKSDNNFGWDLKTLLIYYLPYSFRVRKMPLTAMAIELWLYGRSGCKRLFKTK